MSFFPRSRPVVVVVLAALGAAAIWGWVRWAFPLPMSDVPDDIGNTALAFFFLLTLPGAAAALVAVVGAALLLLRMPRTGGVLGIVALAIAIFHALVLGGTNLAGLADCGGLPRGCGVEWRNIGFATAAIVLSAYLIVALWRISGFSDRGPSAGSV